jgi:manganese-dependent inorganic pyrophosphatase
LDNKQTIYVIGHKNPDTDSICSAIAYADMKNRTEEGTFIPMRAGQINEETEYVLKYFHVAAPAYLEDIGTQVKDMDIHKTQGARSDISVKEAFNLMTENGAVTLPITDEENNLEGLITIGDIARSYMDAYDNTVVAAAKTQYRNIASTLNGEILVGDAESYIDRGKVIIGAANPDKMEEFIDEGDLVILGNRMEDHLCAVEQKAACIIVGLGAKVSSVIQKFARENGCVVIATPYDTLTIAKLINQSIPVRHLMKTKNLITFRMDDFTDDIRDIMGKNRHRDFPVLDKQGKYQGTVSRRNLLNISKKKVILVDHNEKSQAVDNIKEADILEIIDHHRIGSLQTMQPVVFRNQPVGCTATIIYQMYQEKNLDIPENIAGLLCAAIVSDTLMFRSPTCTIVDKLAGQELAKIAGIQVDEFAAEMFRAGSNLQSKSPEEIFYQDFKKFIIDDVTFGVGQINSMSAEELQHIKERLQPYIEHECGKNGIQMVFFMLTNIVEESTELLFYGEGARHMVSQAFEDMKILEDSCRLPGVVSRKKQLIPAFMRALEEV